MKNSYTIGVLFVLSCGMSYSQGFFPLHVGNIWQFYVDPQIPYIQTESIIADTILGNGQSYAVYSGSLLPVRFVRQVESTIRFFSSSDSTEYMLLDFSAHVGDTITGLPFVPSWVALTGKRFNPDLNQTEWEFASGNGPLVLESWTIVDSLGLFRVFMEPGVYWTLAGARINGVVRYGTIVSVSADDASFSGTTILQQNNPNPFNSSTIIRFYLSERLDVSLVIYDLLGRQISTIFEGSLTGGIHSFEWNGTHASSGTYFCCLRAGDYTGVTKLLLLK